MDTPVRKYQKQKDYQRHKLFRKMKRRRKAAIEQAKDAPMKQLRRRLKIPKFEDGKEGSQQMQLGPRYWRDQTIYHDWQNSTIDGGALPEVIVSPTNDASWLFSTGKYVHNPRKPLADKYTRKVVSDYLSKFDDESAKDYNERISRLADVLDIRGVQFKKNDVKSGKLKGRAHYIHQSATAYIDSMKDIFAEVAHPWQYAKGNNNIEEEVGTGKYDSDSDPRGGTRYAYPDTAEGETHSFFEPALTEWIETGKISKSSPILNNELSRQKIKPKDRMEVADSASSWNRQAIERRLLANPDQLPLYKRIQYGLFDYPLLDKKKALGGNLFDDGKDDKPNVFQLPDGTFVNSHNEPLDVLDYAGVEDPTKWTYVDKKGNRYTPKASRTLTEGERFTQRQIENEQNTRPFEFTPYIEGANEGAAAASLMMGFPFNMAGSAYYTAKASRDAYNRNYLGAALNGLGAVTPTGSGILQSAKRLLPKEKTLITAENAANITPEQLDAAYKAAVESGNRPEALRLLEQAYLRSGVPRTGVTVTPEGHAVGWYHGSEWGNHTIFDSSAMNATIGGTSAHGKVKGNFLTTDVPSAMRYAGSSRYSSANVPEYTSPQTFSEKVKNLFGVYKPRRLYPAERVGDYAPKPERLFDTKGKPAIDHLDKVDNVVYPLYVNPGEDIMRLDFQGKPWSQSPVEFPNNFYLRRHIRDDVAKTYRDEIVPYKDYETAYKAWIEDPINIRHGSTSLDGMYFDDGMRSIEGFNSAPRYETVRLIEERVPSTTNGAVQTAAKEGKTSVLMRNVIDSNGGPEGVHYAIDDFVTFKPNQQKLADITYDDNGNLIPLSQRFNWSNSDVRYGLLAPLAGGTALFGYNSLGQSADTYKHGKDSGIHINPKNRGKFNALKKRTGKTTEQLTHSKNPLTRKRAIFAQNAKKFKH